MSILGFSNGSLCIPLEQVLHMDRNDHYGGASSSLNLMQVILDMHILHLHFYFREILLSSSHLIYLFFILFCFSVFLVKTLFFCFKLWKRFKGNDQPKEQLGSSREYNVDMIPKVFRVLCNILLSVRYSDALMLSNYTFHPMFLKHH